MDGALAFIDPPSAELVVDGVNLTIKPLVVRQLRLLLSHVQPVLTALSLVDPQVWDQLLQPPAPAGGEAASELDQDKAAALSELIDFVVDNAERVTAALAVCTGLPPEWLDGLLLDRYVQVLLTVVRVNRDFFAAASPSLRAQVGSLADRATGAPLSTEPARPAPASAATEVRSPS